MLRGVEYCASVAHRTCAPSPLINHTFPQSFNPSYLPAMQPLFTNDAVVFGLLIVLLAVIFTTANSKNSFWQKFYTYVPTLLLCYFLPAFLHWPLGLIAYDWYTPELVTALAENGVTLPDGLSFGEINRYIEANGLDVWCFGFDEGNGHLDGVFVSGIDAKIGLDVFTIRHTRNR